MVLENEVFRVGGFGILIQRLSLEMRGRCYVGAIQHLFVNCSSASREAFYVTMQCLLICRHV